MAISTELSTPTGVELTSDPYEQGILTEDELDLVEPDDLYYREITQIHTKMSALSARLPYKRLAIIKALMLGAARTDIIRDLRTSYATINAALNDPECRTYAALMMRSTRLRKGPSLEARAALLWRIAIREEHEHPRTSIAAIDTLNKQEGIYTPDKTDGDGPLNVTINNFNLPPPTLRQVASPHLLDDDTAPIELDRGDFSHVQVVDIPDTTE
jgi:hypothetical protein